MVGFWLRFIAATTLPLTNDEGSYLYDAFLLGNGRLPFLTSFSRAPGLMVPLALWLKIFGVSVTSGRLLAILASLGSGLMLYFLGRVVKRSSLGLWAFAIYSLISPIIVHGSYLLTEQFEIFYSLVGAYFLLKSIGSRLWLRRALAAGVFFGLAEATRETAAVCPLFLGLGLLGVAKFSGGFTLDIKQIWQRVWPTVKALAVAGGVTVLVWGLLWGLIASQVGLQHVAKNFEAILTMHSTGERLSLGYIVRNKLGELWYLRIDYGILYILVSLFMVLAIVKRWYREASFWLLVSVGLGPLLFYGLYYKRIQPEYFASFMPSSAILSAFVVSEIKNSKKLVLVIATLSVLSVLTFRYQLENPRGGTFYLKPLGNLVTWLKENTKPTDEIFTAAVSIPMFSGRHLALDISRPVIFGYPHLRPDIKYSLFPTTEKIMEYLSTNKVKYYIVEKATRDTFYTGHDDLRSYLELNYHHLETFPNPTNPIELWVRNS